MFVYSNITTLYKHYQNLVVIKHAVDEFLEQIVSLNSPMLTKKLLLTATLHTVSSMQYGLYVYFKFLFCFRLTIGFRCQVKRLLHLCVLQLVHHVVVDPEVQSLVVTAAHFQMFFSSQVTNRFGATLSGIRLCLNKGYLRTVSIS
jgi:hypothetical protein